MPRQERGRSGVADMPEVPALPPPRFFEGGGQAVCQVFRKNIQKWRGICHLWLLFTPRASQKSESLKIGYSSRFFEEYGSIFSYVMNFFFENQKKCLPATPRWRKHIFAPKWWNW